MTHREVTYVPGLYKILDEILVYAADNKQRDPRMDSLSVGIDVSDCRICVYYSAQGVPIECHLEDGAYMPKMIFGDLSNCQDIAGGRNSYESAWPTYSPRSSSSRPSTVAFRTSTSR